MSFIVKGIDLPKEGLTTNINILSNGDIYVTAFDGKRTNYEVLRNSAIQIPIPHGKIIDGDALDQYIEGKGFVIGYKAIDEQKVILEAEE